MLNAQVVVNGPWELQPSGRYGETDFGEKTGMKTSRNPRLPYDYGVVQGDDQLDRELPNLVELNLVR